MVIGDNASDALIAHFKANSYSPGFLGMHGAPDGLNCVQCVDPISSSSAIPSGGTPNLVPSPDPVEAIEVTEDKTWNPANDPVYVQTSEFMNRIREVVAIGPPDKESTCRELAKDIASRRVWLFDDYPFPEREWQLANELRMLSVGGRNADPFRGQIKSVNGKYEYAKPYCPPRKNEEHAKAIEEVYEQRNLLIQVIAMLRPRRERTLRGQGDWPIVDVALPGGVSVSMHLPKRELLFDKKHCSGSHKWDGKPTPDVMRRLKQWVIDRSHNCCDCEFHPDPNHVCDCL